MKLLTIKEAKAMGFVEQTRVSDPTEVIDTQWGELSIMDWLINEKIRIEKDITRVAEIVENRKAYVSLWVNPI